MRRTARRGAAADESTAQAAQQYSGTHLTAITVDAAARRRHWANSPLRLHGCDESQLVDFLANAVAHGCTSVKTMALTPFEESAPFRSLVDLLASTPSSCLSISPSHSPCLTRLGPNFDAQYQR